MAGWRSVGTTMMRLGGGRRHQRRLRPPPIAPVNRWHLSRPRAAACIGLDELCRLDPRFAGYRSSLFSQAATSFSRDAQTPDVVVKLNDQLDGFLGQLSDHFLAPGAFKALEYLIRRYA